MESDFHRINPLTKSLKSAMVTPLMDVADLESRSTLRARLEAPPRRDRSADEPEAPSLPHDPVAHLHPPAQPSWFDKLEAFVSRLSVRDNFWNSICSLIWLPLAFFSGIRMKELEPGSFAAQAILPFRRFNRNWYRAMAGGALLANSEIAGGTYVFGVCGADYTVVCKNLNYTFMRPCLGPAVYRMNAREDVKKLVAAGGEFNVTIEMEISQQGFKGERDRRVGKCEATFHVTPKIHHKAKARRRRG